MKFGIRYKLALAFLLIVIIPVLLTLGGLGFGLWKLERESNEEINRIEKINRELMASIVEGYPYIEDGPRFKEGLKPLLDQYQLQLVIINVNEEIIFNSNINEETPKEIKTTLLGNQVFRYNLPITIDDEVVATAVIIPDPKVAPYNIYSKLLTQALISLGLGLGSLILMIFIFTWYISKGILKPLRELTAATRHIAEGDLDFEISCDRRDELGQFCHTFEVMRGKLKESLKKQSESERARKELIANISHDLRTPISSIKGYVEGLQDGIATSEEMFKRYLTVIKDKTEQLDRLIEDLAQFSQLELGKLDIKKEITESQAFFENIFSGVDIEAKTVPFCLKIKKPIPSALIKVDKHRLEQVIDNIIQNAKRYIDAEGKITIWVERNPDFLQVAIQDNGKGIDPEDLPYIFDSFYRGEKSRSRQYGGTGQGLAISKYIIEAHGGQLWAESSKGKGSCFFFTLPIKG